MIIKSKQNLSTGLVGMRDEGDNTVFTHRYQIEDVAQRAYKLRQGDNNGFTDNRDMRLIGEIPPIFFTMHPEWNSDPNLIKEWLSKDDVGRMFRACDGGI